MKRQVVLSVLAAMTLSASATGQVNASTSDGYLTRGVLMYQDKNYVGCIDQLTYLKSQSHTPAQAEEADYYMAMSAVALGDDDAMARLQTFLEEYPASPLRHDVMMSIGDCYFWEGEYAYALREYDKVDPKCLDGARYEDYTYRVAYIHLHLAVYNNASAGFKKLLNSKTYGNAARFYEGYIAYVEQDYKRAVELFNKVDTSIAPGNMADYYLCQIHFMNGEYNKALAMSKKLIDADVDAHYIAEANRIAGESSYNLGNVDAAIPYLRRYVENAETPLHSSLYILGVSEYKAGEYSKAVNTLTPVTEDNDAMGQSTCLFVGQAMLKLGDHDAAIMAFDKAIKMNFDKDVQEAAFYNYAVAKTHGGKVPFGSSVSTFEEFLRRYPNSRYASAVQEYIVTGYITDQNYESALRSIESVKNPTQAILSAKQRVLFSLGTKDFSAGNTDLALNRLLQAKDLSDHDAEIANECNLWIGDCYYRMNKYDDAADAYLDYLEVAPSNAENRALAYYNLGYARFSEKRYGDAAVDFTRVVNAPGWLTDEMIADAYNRLGDCRYYESKFDDAATYYAKAHELNPAAGDYALYQAAAMRGNVRDYQGKIKLLDQLQADYPTSAYIPDALLEEAECYIALKNNAKAIEAYQELLEKYATTEQGRNGYLQLAVTYQNEGKTQNAIDAYKEIITTYPTSDEAKVATEELKRIYTDAGNLQEYADFINNVPSAPQIEISEVDSLTYQAAERAYLMGEGARKLQDYVNNYPDGANVADALRYLALGAADMGNDDAALEYANRLVEKYPHNKAIIDVLGVKADIEYRQGKCEIALDSYKQLEQLTSDAETLNRARMGIMRVARDLGNQEEVIAAADALLASASVGSDERSEIVFTRAYAQLQLGNNDEAIEQWKSLSGDVKDIYGSKSAVYLAQHYYDEGDLKAARETAEAFVSAQPPHNYWLARGFIILSDVCRKEGKTFEANEYLRALRSNYPGQEPDIFRMIEERLN